MRSKNKIHWKIFWISLIFFHLCFHFICGVCDAKNEANFSIFYTKDELTKIELLYKKRVESKKNKKTQSNTDQIYLQALSYINTHNWVIWVNSTMINSQKPNTLTNLKILNVTEKNVTLEWHDQNYKYFFTLCPHQYLQLKNGKIFEKRSF